MKLSIVATLYRSAPHLAEFVGRAEAAGRAYAGDDFELVLVNDGSPDDSLPRAIAMLPGRPWLRVVDLSRNFGHHKAMIAGLGQARGERIFLLDSDLEEEPEWLPAFAATMGRTGCDMVFGVQLARKGGWFERLSGAIFYPLFNRVTGFDFPKNIVTARLMSRRFVEAFLRHGEREISIGPLMFITGFAQVAEPVKKHSLSPTTYTFSRKFAVFVNSITSFSNRPLEWIFYVGLCIFVLALVYTTAIVALRLFTDQTVAGWTSVMASIWLLGGLIISFLGVIGIYLSKVFMEVKARPNHIIRAVHAHGGAPAASAPQPPAPPTPAP